MDTTFRLPLKTTPNGFMSQECPNCERVFKVAPGQGSSDPVRYCPYCGHEGEGCWWTKEQVKYMKAYATEHVLGPMLEKTFRDFNRGGRHNGFLKISASLKKPPKPVAPSETDDMPNYIKFDCCGETIYHDGREAKLHCPICSGIQNT